MSKNLFTKFFVLLLVVGLLFTALPKEQVMADWSTFNNPDYYYANIKSAPDGTFYRSTGFNPTGTQIVATKEWNDGTYGRYEVVLMDADGSNETVISPGHSGEGDIYQYGNPFWSDDGTAIGYVEVHNNNPNKVLVYDISTKTNTYFYEPVTPADIANPDFLGSSKTSIVFWVWDATCNAADLWTLVGSTLTNITNTPLYSEYEPVSNADGTKILYWSGETTAEPVNTTHTLTFNGTSWVKDLGFTPIADSFWSYWSTKAADEIALTVYSTRDIHIYNSNGTFLKDLSGSGYSGGSGQFNYFGSHAKGPNGEYAITSNAGRGTTAGRDIVIVNPRAELYVSTTGSDSNPGTPAAPFATIGKAIQEAVAGTTIHVAPGTYAGQININKPVSIIGSGKDGANATIISSNAAPTVVLGATGIASSPVVLQNLQITGPGGIRTNITPIDYFTMDNVWLNANPVKSGEGFRLVIGHQLTHLTIKDSIIEGYIDGVIVEKNANTGDSGTKLQYVTVTDTIFRNNYRKGLYTETLSDAVFTNVQLINNGFVNPGTNLAEYNSAGFDLNLKYGAYSNLQFINMTATANGLKAKDGAALMIKARSDGGYAADPATLTDVTITGGSFTGNERGIRFGEPGKDNAGPTNVVISGATILNNVKTYAGTDGSAYGDVVNYSLAKVNATGNWWGSAYGPQAPIYGNIDVIQWCADEGCKTFAPTNGVVELSGNINVPGGIHISVPGLTYHLAANTIVQNASPCFIIEASNVMILAEPGAKCVPTGGSNGIDVAAGLNNITIRDLEIDGTVATGTTDGIHFAGAISDFVLADNKIHDMKGDGIEFVAQPAGVVDIAGNLFQNNTGLGINAGTFSVLAQYNSWGKIAGPVVGTDITSGVTATPFTHADLVLSPINTNTTSRVVTSLANVSGRPTVLKDGNLYHLWSGPSDTTLYHSVSTNPAEFPAGTLVTFSGGTPLEVASTAIFKEGATFYMVAYGPTNQTFDLYSSPDGAAWTFINQVFNAVGMSDLYKIDAPFVFKDGGTYKLYFQKKKASTMSYDLFLATSATVNGTYALANGGLPVLSPTAAAWDGVDVMHPWVVKDGSTYYMWYSGFGGVGKPQQIGLATSSDGIAWTKSAANPIIGPTGEPSVIKDGSIWRMWYLDGGTIKYQTALAPLDLRQTLAYQVSAIVVNVNGAGITIAYPSSLLTIAELTSGTQIPGTFITTVPGQITFKGFGLTALTGNVALFNVTFHTTAQGTGDISLNQAEFGMPGWLSSSNAYLAAAADTAEVEIKELPTMAIDLDSAYYLTAEAKTFTVTITNNGTAYTGAVLNLSLPAGVTVTGVPATIGLAAGASQTLTLTFTSATPGEKAIGFDLKDSGGGLLFSTVETATVYDKPIISSTDIQGYYLVDSVVNNPQEFTVTMTNPLTGRNYSDVMVKITVVGATPSVINKAEFWETGWAPTTYPAWFNVPFAQVGSDLVGWYGGIFYGGFPLANNGVAGNGLLRVDFAVAGSYTVKLELYTVTGVDSYGDGFDYSQETIRLLTSAEYIMVAKDDPVITAAFPAGPYAAGVPVTVPVTITNPGAITGPFELILNLPNGTTFTFGGATYTCTTTCPPVVVTLPVTASDLVITFPGAFTGNVVFNLYDTSWNPDRLVASATQPVVVNSGFAVTGTFSMQGNPSRAGIPVTFTWGGTFATYGPTGFSSAAISNNFSLALTYGGSYTITTLQPRYLNIYCNENTGDTIPDLCKKITVSANYSLPALQLRAGNAVWLDGNNIIDLNDANLVGTQWGQAGNPSLIIDHGDVNFDNKVSIQDLALVGGNYSLTSADAYGTTWVP